MYGSLPPSIVSFMSHHCRSEILWVMPTSVYIPNTDRCFFIIVVFSFQVTSNFVRFTFICMFLLTMWHVSGTTRPLSR